MDGAKALALPIRFGQEMNIKFIFEPKLIWKSTENNQEWFNATFALPNLEIINTSNNSIAYKLKKILSAAQSLNNEFLSTNSGFNININANYPLKWGLGSSSTLISMIAQWAIINDFSLYNLVSNGSGYDIACATQNTPIYYQKTKDSTQISQIKIRNGIKHNSVFVYLGKKQDSNIEIERYKKIEKPSKNTLKHISKLTEKICKASNAIQLINHVIEHEEILSSLLNKPTLETQLKAKNIIFNGAIKSLGAWGGDFAMFVANEPLYVTKDNLKKLGFNTMFTYDELLIKG